MTSTPKEEREEMTGSIRYIKFSGKIDKFEEWKEKTKEISIKRASLNN